jgi:hypothetical protein
LGRRFVWVREHFVTGSSFGSSGCVATRAGDTIQVVSNARVLDFLGRSLGNRSSNSRANQKIAGGG